LDTYLRSTLLSLVVRHAQSAGLGATGLCPAASACHNVTLEVLASASRMFGDGSAAVLDLVPSNVRSVVYSAAVRSAATGGDSVRALLHRYDDVRDTDTLEAMRCLAAVAVSLSVSQPGTCWLISLAH
ncbi:MAG: hypothetical protein VYC16_08255, partial [Pseudomonadota bacterium]|nr:hypothetical protein [Pseudomonadota bacterium]